MHIPSQHGENIVNVSHIGTLNLHPKSELPQGSSMTLMEVRASFSSTSAIGRSWHRDIAGERIPSPVVNQLLDAIDAENRSILLTGLPGSGKTCVMLALQEALEQRAKTQTDLVPLFIQSREFADLATAQERQAQGLSGQWVKEAERMAEEAQVVVVIDSLDVLSIARQHSVLKYFLAQIDRLLLIPKITVITACRDFDRHYDRSIAGRQWDYELKCQPLNWETEIAPLLQKLEIDTSATDAVTRELIQNPRELALFVELAQREGSFNIVTSQALAQRYLERIVQSNDALGDAAIQAIETIADGMLKSRSLAVPQQRFTASPEIQRALLSLNVLQRTQEGKLTFGHQTLLDVLVISRAVRQGVTLNQFIQGLSPVPFVRPSIRSFVAQLAAGNRGEFRKQLRTVLTGTHAFHIRRLVAESLAEQIPEDGDWSLIRDLHSQYQDVFQVIYTQATRVEWHYFWFKYLVPVLKNTQNIEGMTIHTHRVSQWKNNDITGVLAFWADVLAIDEVDKQQVARLLVLAFLDVHAEYSALLAPLLIKLLKLPRQEHSFLGSALAHCINGGDLNDVVLWNYVAGEVSDEDVLAYSFNNKLHCEPHEFGNSHNNFFANRMQQSIALLDLAVESIERWSQIKTSRYGGEGKTYGIGFLHETSYDDTHNENDLRHVNGERILLNAIEAAIVHHGNAHSVWWQSNCERLCFSVEGALRYFALLTCMSAPSTNLDLIGCMLCDKAQLESDLSYELGMLIQTVFVQFDPITQDVIQTTVLALYQETRTNDPMLREWLIQKQAQLILAIPHHLRSTAAHILLDECEKTTWPLIRQPYIHLSGGMVRSPFSFEVFLNASNNVVLRLLAHYNGHLKKSFDDFLVGGESEVGVQLREAASRQPTRFLHLLPVYWADISESFRNEILDGVTNYLAYRYGNLQVNATWKALEEPDAPTLALQILDELERHPHHWKFNRAASSALQACAHVIQSTKQAERLVWLGIGFENLQEGNFFKSTKDNRFDLIGNGINMIRGHITEALMILFENLQNNRISYPDLLFPTLRRLAGDEHPAIRALILRRLPYLQSKNFELGWELFSLTMQNSTGLWETAEQCLYYAYHNNFEKVYPFLKRLHDEGSAKDLETWGRISALAALGKQIDFTNWIKELRIINSPDAWRGAASVWIHSGNMHQYRDQCFSGLEFGLDINNFHAAVIAKEFKNLFQEEKTQISIPTKLINLFFNILENSSQKEDHGIFNINQWLNNTAHHDSKQALEITEIYLAYISRTKSHLYDYEKNLTQLLNQLFKEAEEHEESDHGVMLQRVVAVQDTLLSLGVNDIDDWLKAAERP